MISKVSIIIPCYNHGSFVERALHSANSQTYTLKELILIDDGSADDTKRVLEDVKPQIDHLVIQENQGVIHARNKGIEMATGEYILTLDADDYFESTFLDKAVDVLDSCPEVGMVTCWASVKNHSGEELMIMKPSGSDALNGLFRYNACANLLFRKECWEQVQGYDPNMAKGYEDWEFAIAIGKNGWKIHVIPEILLTIVKLSDSRNKKAKVHYRELRAYVFHKHKELLEKDIDGSIDLFLKEISSQERELLKVKSSLGYNIERVLRKTYRRLRNQIFTK